VNKNLSNDAYYQALNDAIYAALAPLENIRKDSAIRLLGGIIGKGAYEISQEINMDYMTLLKNLDKIANANLMKAVKNIVKDHPLDPKFILQK
jgi:Archaeal putative transposase ISC1217.